MKGKGDDETIGEEKDGKVRRFGFVFGFFTCGKAKVVMKRLVGNGWEVRENNKSRGKIRMDGRDSGRERIQQIERIDWGGGGDVKVSLEEKNGGQEWAAE